MVVDHSICSRIITNTGNASVQHMQLKTRDRM